MDKQPVLADVCNVFALTTMSRAEQMNKVIFDGMVEVRKWMPSDGNDDGMSLIKEKKGKGRKYQTDRNILKPIIKDVNVTWGYGEDKVKDAIKIMSMLGWTNPEFLCPKEAFPMIIKTGRNYENKENEPIIMIAPRIIQE